MRSTEDIVKSLLNQRDLLGYVIPRPNNEVFQPSEPPIMGRRRSTSFVHDDAPPKDVKMYRHGIREFFQQTLERRLYNPNCISESATLYCSSSSMGEYGSDICIIIDSTIPVVSREQLHHPDLVPSNDRSAPLSSSSMPSFDAVAMGLNTPNFLNEERVFRMIINQGTPLRDLLERDPRVLNVWKTAKITMNEIFRAMEEPLVTQLLANQKDPHQRGSNSISEVVPLFGPQSISIGSKLPTLPHLPSTTAVFGTNQSLVGGIKRDTRPFSHHSSDHGERNLLSSVRWLPVVPDVEAILIPLTVRQLNGDSQEDSLTLHHRMTEPVSFEQWWFKGGVSPKSTPPVQFIPSELFTSGPWLVQDHNEALSDVVLRVFVKSMYLRNTNGDGGEIHPHNQDLYGSWFDVNRIIVFSTKASSLHGLMNSPVVHVAVKQKSVHDSSSDEDDSSHSDDDDDDETAPSSSTDHIRDKFMKSTSPRVVIIDKFSLKEKPYFPTAPFAKSHFRDAQKRLKHATDTVVGESPGTSSDIFKDTTAFQPPLVLADAFRENVHPKDQTVIRVIPGSIEKENLLDDPPPPPSSPNVTRRKHKPEPESQYVISTSTRDQASGEQVEWRDKLLLSGFASNRKLANVILDHAVRDTAQRPRSLFHDPTTHLNSHGGGGGVGYTALPVSRLRGKGYQWKVIPPESDATTEISKLTHAIEQSFDRHNPDSDSSYDSDDDDDSSSVVSSDMSSSIIEGDDYSTSSHGSDYEEGATSSFSDSSDEDGSSDTMEETSGSSDHDDDDDTTTTSEEDLPPSPSVAKHEIEPLASHEMEVSISDLSSNDTGITKDASVDGRREKINSDKQHTRNNDNMTATEEEESVPLISASQHRKKSSRLGKESTPPRSIHSPVLSLADLMSYVAFVTNASYVARVMTPYILSGFVDHPSSSSSNEDEEPSSLMDEQWKDQISTKAAKRRRKIVSWYHTRLTPFDSDQQKEIIQKEILASMSILRLNGSKARNLLRGVFIEQLSYLPKQLILDLYSLGCLRKTQLNWLIAVGHISPLDVESYRTTFEFSKEISPDFLTSTSSPQNTRTSTHLRVATHFDGEGSSSSNESSYSSDEDDSLSSSFSDDDSLLSSSSSESNESSSSSSSSDDMDEEQPKNYMNVYSPVEQARKSQYKWKRDGIPSVVTFDTDRKELQRIYAKNIGERYIPMVPVRIASCVYNFLKHSELICTLYGKKVVLGSVPSIFTNSWTSTPEWKAHWGTTPSRQRHNDHHDEPRKFIFREFYEQFRGLTESERELLILKEIKTFFPSFSLEQQQKERLKNQIIQKSKGHQTPPPKLPDLVVADDPDLDWKAFYYLQEFSVDQLLQVGGEGLLFLCENQLIGPDAGKRLFVEISMADGYGYRDQFGDQTTSALLKALSDGIYSDGTLLKIIHMNDMGEMATLSRGQMDLYFMHGLPSWKAFQKFKNLYAGDPTFSTHRYKHYTGAQVRPVCGRTIWVTGRDRRRRESRNQTRRLRRSSSSSRNPEPYHRVHPSLRHDSSSSDKNPSYYTFPYKKNRRVIVDENSHTSVNKMLPTGSMMMMMRVLDHDDEDGHQPSPSGRGPDQRWKSNVHMDYQYHQDEDRKRGSSRRISARVSICNELNRLADSHLSKRFDPRISRDICRDSQWLNTDRGLSLYVSFPVSLWMPHTRGSALLVFSDPQSKKLFCHGDRRSCEQSLRAMYVLFEDDATQCSFSGTFRFRHTRRRRRRRMWINDEYKRVHLETEEEKRCRGSVLCVKSKGFIEERDYRHFLTFCRSVSRSLELTTMVYPLSVRDSRIRKSPQFQNTLESWGPLLSESSRGRKYRIPKDSNWDSRHISALESFSPSMDLEEEDRDSDEYYRQFGKVSLRNDIPSSSDGGVFAPNELPFPILGPKGTDKIRASLAPASSA